MKSHSLAQIAIILGAATVAPAFAQSNVTIYGRLNESIENQKVGTGTAKWVEQNNSSRLGFRGTEDLGGGLKAGFTIEHGLNVDDGKATGGTTFWNRRSEVNLGSSTLAPSAWASSSAKPISPPPTTSACTTTTPAPRRMRCTRTWPTTTTRWRTTRRPLAARQWTSRAR